MTEWARLPVDDIGYIHPAEIMSLGDDELRAWVKGFEERRYGGWRNHGNLWRESLGLDTTTGKHIIDYGCGYGIEALQFARHDNHMTLMDLTSEGLEVAERVLAVHGYGCDIAHELPEADIFYANGVLHHFPEGMQILGDAPCPEARILVYSDRAWRDVGGPNFWRAMDEVGGYADWYSPEALEAAAEGWTLQEATYVTDRGWYLTATLTR